MYKKSPNEFTLKAAIKQLNANGKRGHEISHSIYIYLLTLIIPSLSNEAFPQLK